MFLLSVERALEIQQHGDLVLAEVTEVGVQCLLHKLRETTQATPLRQRAQRAMLPGTDLDGGPHTCMLARACSDVWCAEVPDS